MKRSLYACGIVPVLVATALLRPGWAADVHITIGVPPPPAVVFQSEPHIVVVPGTQVYYAPEVPDYDMYRYGPYWYINRDGYWYRARRYAGPFVAVDYRRVPHQIVAVPVDYGHHPRHPHGGPPGQMKRHGHGGWDDKHADKHRGKHHQHDDRD